MQTPQVRKSPAKNRKNYSRAPWSLSRGRTSPSPPAFIPKHFLQMRQEFCLVCYSSQALTTEKACKKSWLSPNLVTGKSKLEVPPLQPGFRVAAGAWMAILAADRHILFLPLAIQCEEKTLCSCFCYLWKADLRNYPWHKQCPNHYSQETISIKNIAPILERSCKILGKVGWLLLQLEAFLNVVCCQYQMHAQLW